MTNLYLNSSKLSHSTTLVDSLLNIPRTRTEIGKRPKVLELFLCDIPSELRMLKSRLKSTFTTVPNLPSPPQKKTKLLPSKLL